VEEILDAGIDVYTTLNIQHHESLTDIVAQVTGVIMHETDLTAYSMTPQKLKLLIYSFQHLRNKFFENFCGNHLGHVQRVLGRI
jgi:hypothetical protein